MVETAGKLVTPVSLDGCEKGASDLAVGRANDDVFIGKAGGDEQT